MNKKKRNNMLTSTITMAVIALIFIVLAFYKGQEQMNRGFKISFSMFLSIVPILFFAFIIAGMLDVLLPKELIGKWVGTGSGIRGILIGTIVGAFTPGGPYICMPIAATLLRSGASIGTMVAYVTGWSLWAVARLPMDVGILGWKFTIIRFVCSFFFPPIAGLIANIFFKNVELI